MQSIVQSATVEDMSYVADVERHIEERLAERWILRVEHAEDVNPVSTDWQQCGKALYCTKDAKPLIDSIRACRANYPTHAIRLYAEKMQPRARFVYWVYRPQEGEGYPARQEPQPVLAARRITAWVPSVVKGAMAARASLWRVVTVMGVVLASLLVLEEVAA